MGHTVVDGIHTMDDKISAIKNFPQPQTIENVRSSLGLSGYNRLMKGFARIASPVTHLLKKEAPFLCNAPQHKSFTELKSSLINSPVLAFPKYNVPFTRYSDASALGIGAVLMQPDARGKNRAVVYASRTLNQAESNYSVTH